MSLTSLVPDVLNKSLDCIKYASSTIHAPLRTLISTTFWEDVPANTSPVAIGVLIPSVKLNIAPLV